MDRIYAEAVKLKSRRISSDHVPQRVDEQIGIKDARCFAHFVK